jgi:hypothetical protein
MRPRAQTGNNWESAFFYDVSGIAGKSATVQAFSFDVKEFTPCFFYPVLLGFSRMDTIWFCKKGLA